MSTNAPYYARQFSDATNATSPVPSQRMSGHDGHETHSPAAVVTCSLPSHPPSYVQHLARQISDEGTLVGNHTFQDLLVAAHTAAADQVVHNMSDEKGDRAASAMQTRPKRTRSLKSASTERTAAEEASRSKRRRVEVPTDPQLQDGVPGSPVYGTRPSSASLLENARAAGVHSAAALFRRTSDRTSRKHTRPPMSKLFMSLQLTPEHFLLLQSQAKAYMLDTEHPERQNCVGNRGKGDTDMVKLRLFNCVRDFLGEGAGEEFFGENVEKPGYMEAYDAARALGEDNIPVPEDRLTWPRDGNQIISLVTPLMRRMVTNERQRQYAIETRKGGTRKKDSNADAEASGSVENTFITHTPGTPIQLLMRCPDIDQGPNPSKLQALTLNPLASKLSPSRPSTPHLSQINIFVTHMPNPAKLPIKVNEMRIIPNPVTPQLAWYDWNEFQSNAEFLVGKAKDKAKHFDMLSPAEKKHVDGTGVGSLAKEASMSNDPPKDDDDTNLRGVTLATDAVQPGDQPMEIDTHADEVAHEPDKKGYTVKSLCSAGWKEITTEEEWYGVLREKAFAIWADGVCNVIIEMQSLG